MGIASKVSMIAQLVLVGFSFGGIPLFGYLYGRKKAGRDAQAHPLLSDLPRLHRRGAVPRPLPEFRGR